MIQQSLSSSQLRAVEEWRASAADICLHLGAAMAGIGLLYWGLIVVYARSLSSGWVAAFFDRTDPLARLGDPFMWALWLVYWSVAIGLLARGWGERR
jgi:hypothetical protein